MRKKPKWIIQVNYTSDTDEERRINCTSIVQKMIQAQFVGVAPDNEKTEDVKEESPEDLNAAAEKKFEWLKTLTKRERQIFALIATGHDNDEIAEELDLALQTVRNQVSTIYSKLGVKDRFEIIKLANKV